MTKLKNLTESQLELYVDRCLHKRNEKKNHQDAMRGLVDEISWEIEQENLLSNLVKMKKRDILISLAIANMGLVVGLILEFLDPSRHYLNLLFPIGCTLAYCIAEYKDLNYLKWILLIPGVLYSVTNAILLIFK